MKKMSFTLIELLVVVSIIAVLSTLAFIGFSGIYEDNIDKEVVASLKQLNMAEDFYHMKNSSYYASAVLADINDKLKVSLLTGSTRNGDYVTDANGCAQATRNGGDSRTWKMERDDEGPGEGGTCPE